MSWTNYYKILQRTGGDITKAEPREMIEASRANPNSPTMALNLARIKFEENPNLF